jgi:hypothetical protein
MAGRFARRHDGTFAVRLLPEERDVLRDLPATLRDVLASQNPDDPAVRRLFPRAFLDDDEASRAFDALTHEDLARQRGDAADVMAATLDAETLTEEELNAWLSVVNDTRLVLGSRLGVTDASRKRDFSGEALAGFMLFRYLAGLTSQMVRGLSGITDAGLAKEVFKRELKGGGPAPGPPGS